MNKMDEMSNDMKIMQSKMESMEQNMQAIISGKKFAQGQGSSTATGVPEKEKEQTPAATDVHEEQADAQAKGNSTENANQTDPIPEDGTEPEMPPSTNQPHLPLLLTLKPANPSV